MARMESGWNHFGREDADRRGKGAVEGPMEILGRNGSAKLEAGHLRQGMNPGIGAA